MDILDLYTLLLNNLATMGFGYFEFDVFSPDNLYSDIFTQIHKKHILSNNNIVLYNSHFRVILVRRTVKKRRVAFG